MPWQWGLPQGSYTYELAGLWKGGVQREGMAAGTTLLSRDSCSLAMVQIHVRRAVLNMNPGGDAIWVEMKALRVFGKNSPICGLGLVFMIK